MDATLPTIAEAISDLSTLKLFARKAVDGTLSGLHRSDLFGSSIEFAEHKPYSAGDDLRHVDWKVFGRADKYYLKRFEDETNLRAYLVLDSSASMNFGSLGFTKGDYARVLSATLAYLLIAQHDLVSLLQFGPSELAYLPPRGRMPHFQVLSSLLASTVTAGEKKLPEALSYLRGRIRQRGMVLVLSDFIGPISEIETAAKILSASGHDLFWFQILDPVELEFPFSDWTRFEGLEGEENVEAHGRQAARSYQRELRKWLDQLKEIALEHRITYRLIRTDEPVQHVLASIAA